MFDLETMYRLLPAWTRLRDAQQGEPLKALLSVMASQVALLEDDLAQSYDNLFIETCAPWVVPYIGDLVQTIPLTDDSRESDGSTIASLATDLVGPVSKPSRLLRQRADVAKTIYYRRRKTTRPMLEQLATDVTGYAAHVREFFQTLAWSQAVRNHARLTSHYAPDLRRVPRIDRVEGPFDDTPRIVDVRAPEPFAGFHNVPNVGIYLYRLKSTALHQTMARVDPGTSGTGFRIGRLGEDASLFTRFAPGDEGTSATQEHTLPGPLRPAALYDDLRRYAASTNPPGFTDFYGRFGPITPASSALTEAPLASLFVVVNGTAVAPEQVQTMNLETWRRPPDAMVGIDVARGRISLGASWFSPASSTTPEVTVSSFRGFPADMGGGSYDRAGFQARRDRPGLGVFRVRKDGAAGTFTTISSALVAAAGVLHALVSIEDSATYDEALTVEPTGDGSVTLEAVSGHFPHLRGRITITGDHPQALVSVSGLLLEGSVRLDGSLGRLRVVHATLVPGGALDAAPPEPSILQDSAERPCDVELIFSVTGSIVLPRTYGSRLWILDSIVDGRGGPCITAPGAVPSSGPTAWIERSTLVGPAYVWQLLTATDVIFTDLVRTEHRQDGCVRFSFVPEGSTTPRRYRCQPDLAASDAVARARDAKATSHETLTDADVQRLRAEVVASVSPSFTTRTYGQPAYFQLHQCCTRAVREGAEDGSEMGAYSHVKEPQRLKNLQLRLQEYLPAGRAAATIFVT